MAAAISPRNTVSRPDNSNPVSPLHPAAKDTQKVYPDSTLEFLVSDKPAHEKTDRLAGEMQQAMKALASAGTQSLPQIAVETQLEKKWTIKDESSVTLIGFIAVVAVIFVVLNLMTLVS